MRGKGNTERRGWRGGAKQAAADLKAAETTADPQKTAAATEVVRTGDKLRRAYRTFGKGHPTATMFVDEMTRVLGAFLAEHDELSLVVEAHAASVDGEVVYATDRPEESYFFPLYHDGIRQLRFLAGIERAEVEALFEILARSTRRDVEEEEGEDDAVTLLWERDLAHVDYVVIDTFGEPGEESDQSRTGNAADVAAMVSLAMQREAGARGEGGARRPLDAHTRADVQLLQAENLAALDELPAAPAQSELRALFAVDDAARRRLVALLAEDPQLVEKYIEALVGALLPGGDPNDLAELVVLIGQCVDAAVAAGNLRGAARLVRRIRRLLPAEDTADVTRAVTAAMASDAICDGVVNGLASSDDEVAAGAIELAAALPLAGATKLIDRLPLVADRKRRRRLIDEMARFGEGALAAAWNTLARANEEHGLDLLYLILRVGGQTAVDLLDRATRHANPRLRFEALRAYLAAAEPPAAERRGRTALHDPDPAVRRIALDHFLLTRSPSAPALIEDLMRADSWGERDFGEKKRVCLALATLRGMAAAPLLRERLHRRNLLGRTEIDEERAAAAAALGLLRDEESRAMLEKLSSSVLTRALVKHECEEALAQWKQEPAPPPPAAAPTVALTPPRVTTPQAPPPMASPLRPAAPLPPPTVTFTPPRATTPLAPPPMPPPPPTVTFAPPRTTAPLPPPPRPAVPMAPPPRATVPMAPPPMAKAPPAKKEKMDDLLRDYLEGKKDKDEDA